MNARYPIFIPSKGRPDRCLTATLLASHEVPFRIVVEPQDVESYARVHGLKNILELPFSNRGHVSYARNWIMQRAKDENVQRCWMLDDDMRSIGRVSSGRYTKENAGEMLCQMENFTDRYSNVGISAPAFKIWKIGFKTPFEVNRYCACCMLVRVNDKHVWNTVIEDVDYCLQVLSCGDCTLLFYAIAADFASPVATGKSSVAYPTHSARNNATLRTISRWPRLGLRTKSRGTGIDCSRVWRHFTQSLIKNKS